MSIIIQDYQFFKIKLKICVETLALVLVLVAKEPKFLIEVLQQEDQPNKEKNQDKEAK